MEPAEFPNEWIAENIATAFFKCTRWLVEETNGAADCPYHYFCDSTYTGNYPPFVDFSVLLFAIGSYLSLTTFTLLSFSRRANDTSGVSKRRYLLPSGPIALPLMLLAFAKGSRINTLFPMSAIGPSLLHLIQISALAFENRLSDSRSVKYAVLESSTVSGILHASLYLDSVILPYYTGLDALTRSAFSGECETCVCRNVPLVVGGGLVGYRGWSKTSVAVIGTLCSRILCRIFGEEKVSLVVKIRLMLESLSWMLIASDAVYLMMVVVPQGNGVVSVVACGGILVVIFLNVLRKVCGVLAWMAECNRFRKKVGLCQNNVEIP